MLTCDLKAQNYGTERLSAAGPGLIMYTLLYGAVKNMGDFLIYERAKALLRHHKEPTVDFLELHSIREPLDPHLDRVNATRAVIICGGPGIQRNAYPGRYPLVTNLDDIKVPIIILGGGWSGVPGDDATLSQYGFTRTTMGLFERIKRQGHSIGVRDHLTEKALRNNGITNVTMIGCPAWYDLECLERDFHAPSTINTIAFTPPARSLFHSQAVDIMRMLRRRFPDARLICSFHRGITADAETPTEDARWLGALAQTAEELGFDIVDTSYGIEKATTLYADCDLHVGYRVHGHLLFLSRRKPSFLVHEDGRGRGASEALGLPGIQGWTRTVPGKIAARVGQWKLSAYLERELMDRRASKSASAELEELLAANIRNGFKSFDGLAERMRRHYETMVQFLQSIP